MAKNILIVDESAPMRKTITHCNRKAGIENARFQEPSDGIAGLKDFESGTFDLILSDVDEALSHGAKGCLKSPFTAENIQRVIGPFLK